MFLYRVRGSAGRCRQRYSNDSHSGTDQDFLPYLLRCFFDQHDSNNAAKLTAGCVLAGCILSFGRESAVSGQTAHRPRIWIRPHLARPGHRGGPINYSDADWADPLGLHFPDSNARRLARILETLTDAGTRIPLDANTLTEAYGLAKGVPNPIVRGFDPPGGSIHQLASIVDSLGWESCASWPLFAVRLGSGVGCCRR
jgi:hypothetical protein